jgi:polyhydroxybutyrate depolymerase
MGRSVWASPEKVMIIANRSTLCRLSIASTLLAVACAPETELPPPGTGGSAGVGGSAGSGGSSSNVGGSAGVLSKGGTGGTAASAGTGGGVAASAGTGGGAGVGTGGGAGRGGMSGAGGSGGAAAGSGGNAGTGTAGKGGAATTDGCGKTTWPESDRYTIDVEGSSREYILEVPEGYDSSQPYRLIFGWHWRGGQASDVAGNGIGGGAYYGLESRAEGTAIFVSPEGLDQGWANPGGRDIDFLNAMLERLQGEFCIDRSRIFSTGFSFGGMMSLAVGCAKGDVFRAIAPMSGAFYSGCEDGNNPVAFIGIHGDADNVVPLSDGEEGRDEFLARNGCGTETMPTGQNDCVSYQGCMSGYPVVWCEFGGGHSPPSFSGEAVWAFFSQF